MFHTFYHPPFLICRSSEGSLVEFDLKTKYYDARLKLMSYECITVDEVYGSEPLIDDLQFSECFLDIVPFNQVRSLSILKLYVPLVATNLIIAWYPSPVRLSTRNRGLLYLTLSMDAPR